MNQVYFSDKEKGAEPRINEKISLNVWRGIRAKILTLIDNGSFGYKFPEECKDGGGNVIGTKRQSMSDILKGEIPEIIEERKVGDDYIEKANILLDSDRQDTVPSTLTILDIIQFSYKNIAKPTKENFHEYFKHHHLVFDRDEGQKEFREDINLIFARNGIIFDLQENGQIIRLAPPILREKLSEVIFLTRDNELNEILESARTKYLDPNISVRRESLEKLWDAWERIKTIEPAEDKKQSTKKLLDKASLEPNFLKILEEDAKKLTEIGNQFQIRHSEINKTPVNKSEHIDYLFQRLFAIIYLLLKSSVS
ncbi:conserved hypothetical protein [Candidatus Brocadia pituitae]|nr:conserved hypothetical protein [Candidatus Brocadia pituitae]